MLNDSPVGCQTHAVTEPQRDAVSRRLTEGIRTLQVLERPPVVVRQNVHLLIPSVTAAPCHLPLVTKGRLGCARVRIGAPISATLYCAGGVEPRPYGSIGGAAQIKNARGAFAPRASLFY